VAGTGRYGDGQHYLLPDGWPPVLDEVMATALSRTHDALAGDDALQRLAYFYDLAGDYAGTSFLDVQPNPSMDIHAADLYAVTRLTMTIGNRQSRLLLNPGSARNRSLELLEALPPEATIANLTASLLDGMWTLHNHLRSMLSSETRASTHWVFAAKLCARKRPYLFPVRDGKVCAFLAGSNPPSVPADWLGLFNNDIQVFAYLMTHKVVVDRLNELRRLCAQRDIRVDTTPLRLLDALLWTKTEQETRR
jgi:hypothetical protein